MMLLSKIHVQKIKSNVFTLNYLSESVTKLSFDEIIHSFTSPGCRHLRGVPSTRTIRECLDESKV